MSEPPGAAPERPLPDPAQVAAGLAEEVRAEPGFRGWRRMTTLLDLFGHYRLTPDTRDLIANALAGANLHAEPDIHDVHRHETVRLTVEEEQRLSTVEGLFATKVIRFFDWVPGERPRELELNAADAAQGVLWVDIDVLTADAEDVHKALARVCGRELSREIVDDLLEADQRPKVVRFPHDEVRLVASLHVAAEEYEAGAADAEVSKAGRLVFRPIEIAAGDGWIVTSRHKGGRYEGGREVGQVDPLPLDDLIARVGRAWVATEGRTPGDLGMLVLDDLAESYRPAHRELYAWLESWELDFNERLHQTEQQTLKDIRGLLSLLRVRLTSLSPSHDRPGDAWFGGLSSEHVAAALDRRVERALRQLAEMTEVLRTSFQVLTTAGAAEQLRLAQEQQQRGERLDDRITVITSLLLVPTLVVGIYGANTKLPGRDAWFGFELMLLLMAASAIVSYLLVRRARGGGDDDHGER